MLLTESLGNHLGGFNRVVAKAVQDECATYLAYFLASTLS